MATADATELRRRIQQAEEELRGLRAQLAAVEAQEQAAQTPEPTKPEKDDQSWPWPLRPDEYERYARQLILPAVGVRGQQRLRDASVLIVGAGGLGCPAAAYLAGAGVGHVGVVDGDVVEASNLHRQIGHATARVGQGKAASLVAYLRQLNPGPRYTAHAEALTPANAARIFGDQGRYTLVLDCTDHPAARYLVSDACVRAGVPLVSAAALRTDGQLAVLNHPVGRGPCYRCVFPRPPPPASQQSCAEGGVLGPVVGAMGVLQALEGLRVLLTPPAPPDEKDEKDLPPSPPQPSLLIFSAGGKDALRPPSFRTVRLRGRRPDCVACGTDAALRQWASLDENPWPDYVQFCGGGGPSSSSSLLPLRPDERISAIGFNDVKQSPHWLLDVREKEFYDMGSLPGAVNVPFSRIQSAIASAEAKAQAASTEEAPSAAALSWLPDGLAKDKAPVYVVCRVGNDSQVVARQLKKLGIDQGARFVGDIAGGIQAWKRDIDSTIPFV